LYYILNILKQIGQILVEETAVLAEGLRYLNWLDLELMFPCLDKREQIGRCHWSQILQTRLQRLLPSQQLEAFYSLEETWNPHNIKDLI
jgi:hypothetical protein